MEDSLFGSEDRLQAGRRDANIYRFSNVRNAGTGIEESLRPLLAAILAAEELVAAFPRTPTQCALRIAPTTALLAALVCAPADERLHAGAGALVRAPAIVAARGARREIAARKIVQAVAGARAPRRSRSRRPPSSWRR